MVWSRYGAPWFETNHIFGTIDLAFSRPGNNTMEVRRRRLRGFWIHEVISDAGIGLWSMEEQHQSRVDGCEMTPRCLRGHNDLFGGTSRRGSE
jgi:hypothetical protein